MPYIKLLTALAGLALLTACGGAAATKTAPTATDCTQTPFHADCLTNNAPALLLRQNMCLTNDAIHSTCDEVIVGVCEANPFQSTACLPDDTYLSARIAECITGGKADTPNCTIVTNNTAMNTMLIACLENPFDTACESVPDFTSSFEQARMNRAIFCDNSDNVANDFCTGDNVRPICRFDPFTAICFTGTTYLSNRVNNCITAGNANSNNNCNTVFTESASNTCLTNPFTDACTIDADFGTYANMARTNRVTFCGTNSSDTICDTLTACQNNPFATECEAYFQTERENRVTFCEANTGNALCIGANLMTICGFNPFSTLCTSETYLTNRQVQCAMNTSTHTSCTTLLGGLADASDLPAYPALPASATPTGFLEGTPTGIDTTGFTNRPGSGSLNATATAGTGENAVSLDGATTDGVAWADINFTDSGVGFYAGIFSGTNMGAALVRPDTDPEATVAWKGIIQGTSELIQLQNPTPFTLNVDLYNRTLKAFLPLTTSSNVFAFSIDGTYTANGLIGGTVFRGFYTDNTDPDTLEANTSPSPGMLTGLIGAKGAVAAFHSNTLAGGYAGGFIVKPPE